MAVPAPGLCTPGHLPLPGTLAQQPGLAEVRQDQRLPQAILSGSLPRRADVPAALFCLFGKAWFPGCFLRREAVEHWVFKAVRGLWSPCLGAGRASQRVSEPPSWSSAGVLHSPGPALVPLGGDHWGGTFPGKPQLGKRVVLDHVAAPSTARHDFSRASGLCPGRVLPCCMPPWSAANRAGLLASQEQGGDQGQHIIARGFPAGSSLALPPSGHMPRPCHGASRRWWGHVPTRGCQEWSGGMRGLLSCHLLAQPGSLLCCTG